MRARSSISVAPGSTRGDAGRRAGSARAQRYVAGITPVLEAIMRDQERSAQAVAIELTRRAVRKPRGGVIWTSADAQRLLRRLNLRPARHLGHKHRERETSSPAFSTRCFTLATPDHPQFTVLPDLFGWIRREAPASISR